MPQNINFLAQQQRVYESRVKANRTVGLWIAVLSAVTFVVWAATTYTNYYFKSQTRAANNSTTKLKQIITEHANSEMDYLTFYQKLSRLRELLELRQGGTEAINDTFNYFAATPNSTLMETEYDYEAHELALTVGCKDVFCVSDILDMVRCSPEYCAQSVLDLTKDQPLFTTRYPNAYISGISRSDTGTYSIYVDIPLQGSTLLDRNFEEEVYESDGSELYEF